MLTGLSILIVEDEPIIAMLMAQDVEKMGGVVLGPFASVAEALVMLADTDISGAVMDANLLDRDITPVALHLLDRGVPFVIYSGTGLPPALAARIPYVPLEMKPGQPLDRLMAIMGANAG
ncbi:response regulator [Sphingobium sp. Z007]|uniref:response regulator n=1 Tax=Sphingobium sp. Z007 TaxID=627495 RepID=UPI0020CD2092|nr:response regulator [Sphingobium sp. Z007]